MIPGEIITQPGDITLNEGREAITLMDFDRRAARGMRLDIAAGTAVRFEPGQSREVALVPYSGARIVTGFNQQVMGALD